MMVQKDFHTHTFKDVYKKLIPLRTVVIEGGITKLDRISGKDTIYYYKCKDKKCNATQAFHMTRDKV